MQLKFCLAISFELMYGIILKVQYIITIIKWLLLASHIVVSGGEKGLHVGVKLRTSASLANQNLNHYQNRLYLPSMCSRRRNWSPVFSVALGVLNRINIQGERKKLRRGSWWNGRKCKIYMEWVVMRTWQYTCIQLHKYCLWHSLNVIIL